MRGKLKQLGKDAVVYGLGGILAKSIGFFLLPVYTRLFTPADYGTIEMLVVLNSFLGSILVMGMDAAQSFYFFEQAKEGEKAQARVVTAILQWRITWGSGIVLLATLLSPLLNKYFFNGQLSWEYFAIAFIGTLFGQIMSQSVEVFRLLYKPWSYISITLGQTLGSAAIAITLIVGFGFGILGFFVGMLSGSVLAATFGWWRIRNYVDFSRWHSSWWPKVLKFGAPLVPAGLGMYVLNSADRWFISYYHGQDALGLYAVGAKFAMLISMAVTTFRQAWWPVAMDAMHSKDGPEVYRTIARLYLGIGSAGVVFLTAISPLLVNWLTTPAYFDSYPIVGILAWHSIFYGFFLIGAGGIWKAEKTAWAPFLMGAAELINVGLNALLVPNYGVMGAAFSTSVSFCVWIILTLIVSERLWRVGYDYGILLLQVTIGASACGLTLVLYKQEVSPWSAWLVAIISVALLSSSSISFKHFSSIMLRLNLRMRGLETKAK
jgi:O-antigen/teichoic acid export membrane protein